MFAPVRGARIVLWDDQATRADMTASWLAQMAWEVYVLDAPLTPADPRGDHGSRRLFRANGAAERRRPAALQAPVRRDRQPPWSDAGDLEWEYGLVAQLERDGTHGFFVI